MGSTTTYRLTGPDGRKLVSTTPGTLGGHRRTKVYGRLDCPVALSLIARGYDLRRDRVFFADEETAIAAGYRPCGVCLRGEYHRWKEGRADQAPEGPGRSRRSKEMHRAGGDFVRPSD